MTQIVETATLETKSSSGIFTTGLALFSMFFGAGNLIFPLIIGKSVGVNAWYAVMGLGITAVLVPLLGLTVMILFQADCQRFFGRLGKIPGALLFLLLQLILGPFGVIPRLVTLMHAMLLPYLPDMSLMLFSVGAAILIVACSFQRQRLIPFLGAVFTPILLLSLGALVVIGLINAPAAPTTVPAGESFLQGLLGGYHMMDLIAAFLFATVVLPHFQEAAAGKNSTKGQRSVLKKVIYSGLIAAALLLLTYIGLCFISSYHSGVIDPAHPQEQLLSAIAIQLLGPVGGAIAAIAVITACLTTAMTLSSIFADYLRKDICKEKISPAAALVLTLLITTFFANLGFSGIVAFLGPILQIVYPGLILLTLLNLLHLLYKIQMVKLPVFAAFTCCAVIYLS